MDRQSGPHAFDTIIQFEFGETKTFEFADSQFAIRATVQAAEAEDADVEISLELVERIDGSEVVISSPRFLTNFERNSRVESSENNGDFYSLSVSAHPS